MPDRRPVFRDADHVVPAGAAPERLDRVLRAWLAGSSWGEVRRLIATGKIRIGAAPITDEGHLVAPGTTIELRMNVPRKAPPAREEHGIDKGRVLLCDTHVIVVRKPAGICTVAFDGDEDGPRVRPTVGDEPTLDALVRAYLLRGRGTGAAAFLHIVQRLDRETSGVMVFARTLLARDQLRAQFRKHTVQRRYLAIAHGSVTSTTHRTRLVRDRGDGRRGSTQHRDLGKESITHVEVVEHLRGATLVECRLETGRTNQIRIHLSEAGHPLLGETLYRKGFKGEVLEAPRVMLHAAELGFAHPVSGEMLQFEEPMPDDMRRVLATLRA